MNAEAPSDYEFRRALANIQHGEHLGLIYACREEQMAAITPMIQLGLERGERCIYVVDENSVSSLHESLAQERRGWETAIECGRLLVFTKESSFLLGGKFDPARVLEFCRNTFKEALAAGFNGVRFFAEMTWTLGGKPDTEQFLEYEAKVNELARELPAIVVCQYNRTRFAADMLIQVLRTHPFVIYGKIVGVNPYYVPPEEARAPSAEAELERLLDNLREREQAQSRFRQRFVAFMDHLPAFTWIKDLEGRHLYTNGELRKLPVYAGEWHGKTDAELWPAKEAAHFRANDVKVIAERKAIQTIEHFDVNGETRYALVSKFPIFDQAGRLILVGGASVEITERIRAEQALRASEERFRQLAENIHEIFWVQHPETGAIEYVSPAYEQIWKRSAAELLRNPQAWMESIHPDDREGIDREHAQPGVLRAHDHHYRILWPDGTVRWIRDRAFPVHDAEGRVTRIVGLAEDVTVATLNEQALRKANERLQMLSRRLYEVQERERRHLARELHDEIGQALTAAKFNLKSACATAKPEVADRIGETMDIVDGLIGKIRVISLNLRPSLLDDLGLVPALRSLLDQLTRRADLAPTFFAHGVPEVLDAEIQTACFRIAQEALTNVLRHAQARTVSLELRVDENELHLTITDNGKGFQTKSLDEHANLVQNFGLVSITERAELVGGHALILSTPGIGTMVDVRLPLVRPRNPEEAAP